MLGGEVMRSEFEKRYSNSKDKSASSAFAAGWQHQQSKVDELTKQRDSFIKAYEIEIDKSDELQKRVDESLRILVDIKKKGLIGSQYSIFDLEQVLKGGPDE